MGDQITVSSRRIQIDLNRHVSVGTSVEEPGTTFVEFSNSECVTTRLKLSEEAVDALLQLLNERGCKLPTWVAA